MRIGYAFGNKQLIKYLNDVKYSFNSYTMNYPSLVIGRAALADRAYFEENKEQDHCDQRACQKRTGRTWIYLWRFDDKLLVHYTRKSGSQRTV